MSQEELLLLRISAVEIILAEYKRDNQWVRSKFCPIQIRELRASRWLLGEVLEMVRGGDKLEWMTGARA